MEYQIPCTVITLVISLLSAGYVNTIVVPMPPDASVVPSTSLSSTPSPSATSISGATPVTSADSLSMSPSLSPSSSLGNIPSSGTTVPSQSSSAVSSSVSVTQPGSSSPTNTGSPSPAVSPTSSSTAAVSATAMSQSSLISESQVSQSSSQLQTTSSSPVLQTSGASSSHSSVSSMKDSVSPSASQSSSTILSTTPTPSVSASLSSSEAKTSTSKAQTAAPTQSSSQPAVATSASPSPTSSVSSSSSPAASTSALPATSSQTAASSSASVAPSSQTSQLKASTSADQTVAPTTSVRASPSVIVPSSTTASLPTSKVTTASSERISSMSSPVTTPSSSAKAVASSSMTQSQSPSPSPSPSSSSSPSPSPSPSPPPDKVFYASFKVATVCSDGIKENNPNSPDYVNLRNTIITACVDAFKNDSTFKRCVLDRFDCGSVIPQVQITKSGAAPVDANVALKPLSDRVMANTLKNLNVNSQSFSAARTAPPVVEPNLYVIMELLLSNNEFCPNLKDFKDKLASRVLKADGATSVSSSQVVVFENECNNLNAAGTNKAKPRFYIAQDGNINTPDTTLTKRAHDLIDQYIKDGTTSRLGAAFDSKVIKVSYGGKDAPEDDKLSDLAIVFIAIGATVGILLLIILIILICRGTCRSDKPNGSKKPKEVKMTNPIYMEEGVGARDNPALVLDDESKKGTNDKIKIDENDYEYPTGPANGSAPRNGVTHVEVNSNNNEGYVDMEPAEYQPLEDIPHTVVPTEETEAETPPPDYQELNVVEPPKNDEDPLPQEYIEFTERPSSEEPSESQSPEPVVVIAEVPVEATPEEAPLVADAPPMLEAEETPKEEVTPEEEPKEIDPPPAPAPTPTPIEVEYSLPPPPPAPEPEEEDTVSLPPLSTTPIGLAELEVRKDDNDLLKTEFESIEYSLPDTSIYPPALIEKNRYPSIVPRPETRVVLPSLPASINSDYINANFVRDLEGSKSYIATQGPLQGTANDFWRMIWDQNASVVVMVSPLIHMGMEKCFQYWPPDSISRRYGTIDVQLKKKELRPDFTVTTMTVKQESEIRELILYRFMTWPEDAIPENAKSAVTYLLEVRKHAKVNATDPLVVHCSDGVGVTGAFIAVDMGMRSLDQNQTVDVVSLVRSIREDRSGAVQTLDQYRFIYQALYEYAVIIGSTEAADALQKAKSNNNNATSKM